MRLQWAPRDRWAQLPMSPSMRRTGLQSVTSEGSRLLLRHRSSSRVLSQTVMCACLVALKPLLKCVLSTKIDEFCAKKHDFLLLRHPQKPRAKNKHKSAQKATQGISSFETLFRYFWIFSDVFFSCFFSTTSWRALFPFSVPNWLPKAPFWRSFWRLFGVRVET